MKINLMKYILIKSDGLMRRIKSSAFIEPRGSLMRPFLADVGWKE